MSTISSDPQWWTIGGENDEVQKTILAAQQQAAEAQKAFMQSTAAAEPAPKTKWLPFALGGIAGVLLVIVLSNSKKR